MALKDWKKEEFNGTMIFKKGSKNIRIEENLKIYGQSGYGVYINDLNYEYYEILRKKFETKQEALAYARNYMRKN